MTETTPNSLGDVITIGDCMSSEEHFGVKFTDGIELVRSRAQAAA